LKKKYFAVAAGIVVVVAVVLAIAFSVKTETKTDYAMNTVVTFTVTSRNPNEDIDAALKEIKRIDALMSISSTKGDVYKINSAKSGTAVKVSKETFSLIEMSLDVSQKTEGAFDITVNPLTELWNINSPNPKVPEDNRIKDALSKISYKNVVLDKEKSTVTLTEEGMSINLGAVAKGYAADRVADILKKRNVTDAIVDLGGNIYALGEEKNIGIQTPFEARGNYFTTCKVKDESVVTSGAYERYFEQNGKKYHHILNTKNGYPAQSGISGATVISKNSALADALSTAIFAMGEEKTREVISGFENVRVIILKDNGKVVRIDN